MRESRPFLATTSDFSKAFPQIKDLEVIVVQDKYGYYIKDDWARKSSYNVHTVRSSIGCRNNQCKRGGLDLQQHLRFMVESRTTGSTYSMYCEGDEGTPAGRKRGDPCMNCFDVSVKIVYHPVSK
jgi:hypothetical protein